MGSIIKDGNEVRYQASTQDIFIALTSEAQWLDLLEISDKKVLKLINIIQLEGRKTDDEQGDSPSIKTIAKEIGTNPTNVSDWVVQLYDDLWQLNWQKPELFHKGALICECYFKGGLDKQYCYFKLGLQHPFTPGDNFNWVFLRGKFSLMAFHVTSVGHEHINGKMKTFINFKIGYGNRYREMLLEKARFLEVISYDELIDLPEYKIDELLQHRVEKGLSGFPESMTDDTANFNKKKNRY
jgi:hypothetical protein